jgi:enterochelin esterase-like enzyme
LKTVILGFSLAIRAAGLVGAPAPASTPVAPAGKVEEFRVASPADKRERRVWVYSPPVCASGSARACDFLVVFDGREYLEDISLPRILDALLAGKKAGPFVAVLIDNSTGGERLADLANHARFADFVGGELVEWARGRWNVTRNPHRTIVAGSSAGGLAAAYVAFRRPEVFGNVLSQSGAFWRGNEGSNGPPYEWLTGQVAASPKKDIRFLLEVGSKESAGAMGGQAPSILEANRRLRDALRAKGYVVTFAEVPNGTHSQETWRERLPAAIASLARPPGK